MIDRDERYKKIAKDVANSAIQSISKQLTNAQLKINKNKKQFVCQKSINNIDVLLQKQRKINHEIKTLKKNKQNMINQIQKFQYLQNNLRKQKLSDLNRSKNSSLKKKIRSQFTKQEIKQIKLAIKNKQTFQLKLKQKQDVLNQKIVKQKQQNEEMRKKIIQQRNKNIRQQLQKNHQIVLQRQKQRQQRLKQEIIKLKHIKERTFLYQKIVQQQNKNKKQQQEHNNRILLEKRQKNKALIKDIKQHQTRYMSQNSEKALSRVQSLLQSRMQLSKYEAPFPSSIYLKRFLQAKRQEQQKSKQKQKQKQQCIQKKRLYSKHVNQIFLPKLKIKTSSIQQPDRIFSSINTSLNQKQVYELGNSYMKAAHNRINKDIINKDKQQFQKQLSVDNKGGYSGYYKNYLKQIRKNSSQRPNISASLSNLLEKDLKSPKQIQKVNQLIKIKERTSISNREMIDSIRNKLKILNKLVP